MRGILKAFIALLTLLSAESVFTSSAAVVFLPERDIGMKPLMSPMVSLGTKPTPTPSIAAAIFAPLPTMRKIPSRPRWLMPAITAVSASIMTSSVRDWAGSAMPTKATGNGSPASHSVTPTGILLSPTAMAAASSGFSFTTALTPVPLGATIPATRFQVIPCRAASLWNTTSPNSQSPKATTSLPSPGRNPIPAGCWRQLQRFPFPMFGVRYPRINTKPISRPASSPSPTALATPSTGCE